MNNIKNIILYILIVISLFANGQDSILTLEKAISITLEQNYGIIISKLEANQASINNHWGNAGRYPSINFTGFSNNRYNITDDSSNENVIGADLGLNWTLFNGFKVIITKNKLAELENLAKGRSAVVIENTIENVILGYYLVLLEKEKLDVLNDILQLSEDRYQYEQKRKELGSSVTYQVLQAKNNYLSDKVSYMSQEIVVRNALRNLNFLMGMDTVTNWSVEQEFKPDSTDYLYNDLRDKMLTSNKTLQNQYINLKLKQYETGLQKVNWYPMISLSSGISYNQPYAISRGNLSGGNDALGTYGNINLTYNIFTGGVRKRAIEVAKISEEIVETETDEIKHILLNQLMNTFDMYNVRKAILKVADENLETVALNLKITREKYKTGVINSFNYREIQLNYISAAIERLEAIYNLIESHTGLVRLTGGLINQN